MDVIGLPEFLRCLESVATTGSNSARIEGLLQRLSREHTCQEMREEQLRIPGTDIELWLTRELRLDDGALRAAWRYDEQEGRRVVACFTLVRS
ncbi:MAG: hypothetical protein BMS9Abin17_0999 [Acidimicrobiia bacterium]|nr:MAG: hypothetical protein BMS9Abin17_0999 [Acidimicrobiia bacterium]